MYLKPYDRKCADVNNFLPIPGHNDDVSRPAKAGRDSPQNSIQLSTKDPPVGHGGVGPLIPKPSNDLALGIEDLVIPWSDLELKERIGAGIFHIFAHIHKSI